MRKINNEKDRLFLIDKLKGSKVFRVKKGEEKTIVIFLIRGKDESGEIQIIIEGKRADVEILGIVLGWGHKQINIQTLQDHRAGESRSRLLIKSILFDEAKLDYQGLIKISQKAHKSDAYQKNQTILMSSKALAVSKPHLEIFTDSVKCAHGVTISPIDEDQLYYLQTRGLARSQAIGMIVEGFYHEIIDKITDKTWKSKVEQKLRLQLGQLLDEWRN